MLNEFEEELANDELKLERQKTQTSVVDFIAEKLPAHLLCRIRLYFFPNQEGVMPFSSIQNLILLLWIYSTWKIISFLSYFIPFLLQDDLAWSPYFTEDLVARLVLIIGTILFYQKQSKGWFLLTAYCLYSLVIQAFYTWLHFDASSLSPSTPLLYYITTTIWLVVECGLLGIFLVTLSSENARASYIISNVAMYVTYALAIVGSVLLYIAPLWDDVLYMIFG